MNQRTFKRIKMLREEGMGMKGAITVIIDLCANAEEASEKIIELVDSQPKFDYDRGFCDGVKEANLHVDSDITGLLVGRKGLRNYDPPV